jgi:glutamate-1-semialdehyde 2,1-aminomutase
MMSPSPETTTRPNAHSLARSAECFEAARGVLVGGVDSPVRAFRGVGGHPVFVRSAAGAHIIDVDGNRYVDLVGSWGPAIVGHAHPDVVKAVQEAAADGLSFGACCERETELGRIVVDALPSVDLVRFVNSGTEATMSAVRLARAASGRPRVLKFLGCYHGHVDALLVAAGSGAATFGVPDSAGVPEAFASQTLLAPYNDLDAVERVMTEHGDEIAAIIVEPIAGNMGFVPPAPSFLEGLRALCDRSGALLIFDEVMTGFRVAWGGQQVRAGVRPDLTCLGKVIGGGMPVAAYGGRRDLMEMVSPLGPVYQAGTLSGNPLGMASGVATLTLCREAGFYDTLERTATALAEGLRDAARAAGVPVQTGAAGGMLGFALSEKPVRNYEDASACDHERFARFFHEMLRRGVWLPPSGYEAMFVSAAHGEGDIEHVVKSAAESFEAVAP